VFTRDQPPDLAVRRAQGVSIRGSSVIAFAVALAACSASNEATPVRPANWESLPDGSRYVEQRYEGEIDGAARCWPKGDYWDCLNLMFDGSDGGFAQRRIVSNLSVFDRSIFPFDDSGYQCSFFRFGYSNWDINERVHDEAEAALITNQIFPNQGLGGDFWMTQYVAEFLKENRINGGQPFSCHDVWQLIRNGSPATVRATAFSRERIESYSGEHLSNR